MLTIVNISQSVYQLLQTALIISQINYKIVDDDLPIDKLYIDNNNLILSVGGSIEFNCDYYYNQVILTRLGKKNLLSRLINQQQKLSPDLTVLDMFAGFGSDGFMFLSHNCEVTAIEVNPYIFLVLSYFNTLYYQQFQQKMTLHYYDCYQWLLHKNNDFNIYYLDPMFNSNKKSLPRKSMQVIAYFSRFNDRDIIVDLFDFIKNSTVIVKRDNKQPPIAFSKKIKPNFSLSSKLIRFDLYLL